MDDGSWLTDENRISVSGVLSLVDKNFPKTGHTFNIEFSTGHKAVKELRKLVSDAIAEKLGIALPDAVDGGFERGFSDLPNRIP